MNQEQKIKLLLDYYSLFDKKEWRNILNHYLPLLLSSGKKQSVNIYERLIKLYEIDGKTPSIDALASFKYDKKQLSVDTIDKYLKGLVEAMRKVLAITAMLDDKDAEDKFYLKELKNRAAFQQHFEALEEIAESIELYDFSFSNYSIYKDYLFHHNFDFSQANNTFKIRNLVTSLDLVTRREYLILAIEAIQLHHNHGMEVPPVNISRGLFPSQNKTIMLLEAIYDYEINIKDSNIDSIKTITSQLIEDHRQLADYDLAYCFGVINNALTRGYKRTRSLEYLELVDTMTTKLMSTAAVLIDGIMHYQRFLNLIYVKCEIALHKNDDKYTQAISRFITTNLKYIDQKFQEEVKVLSFKYYYLVTQEFEKCNSSNLIEYSSNYNILIDRLLEFVLSGCYDISNKSFFRTKKEQLLKILYHSNFSLPTAHEAGYQLFLDSISTLYKCEYRLLEEDKNWNINHIHSQLKEKVDAVQSHPSYVPLKTLLLRQFKNTFEKHFASH